MPTMRSDDKVIAILSADIHLSINPPRARRDEPNWFRAMRKPLDDLFLLSSQYKAPILCAGDLFDHWRSEPALINFALKYLPEMYAIPGQHDLPLHNIDLIEKSAFWTLCLCDRVIPVITEEPIAAPNNIVLHGFPWGKEIEPLENRIEGKHHIALVHKFIYKKGFGHPNAPRSQNTANYIKKVKGYDAVIFGDNHKGFEVNLGGVPVWNCGGFMRRNQDEKDSQPRIGLLCASGKILTHKLVTRSEKFKSTEEDFNEGNIRRNTEDMADVLHGLKDTAHKNLDYAEAIEFLMEKYTVKNNVRKILMEALERE